MPKVFLIMGGCYFVLQLVGILMISEPSEEEAKEISSQAESLIETRITRVCELNHSEDACRVGGRDQSRSHQEGRVLADLVHHYVRLDYQHLHFLVLQGRIVG